jgi:hypothetical protein
MEKNLAKKEKKKEKKRKRKVGTRKVIELNLKN